MVFFSLVDFPKRVVSKVCAINVDLQCYQAKSSSAIQTDLSTLQESLESNTNPNEELLNTDHTSGTY